jgi:hypothetical protein
MAAATTTTTKTTSNFLKPPNHPNSNNNQPITKPKRRKCRETTISTSVSTRIQQSEPDSQLPDSPSPNYTVRYSPGTFSPIMDHFTHSSSPISVQDPFPSSFTKFNSALTAGLLNPMSPPPDKTRSSPTLFEMMVNEPDIHHRTNQIPNNIATTSSSIQKPQIVVQDRETLMMHRISELLSASRSPGNHFNDSSSSDIKLTLSSKDGFSVSMNVHRQILVAHSRFFSVKLSDRWTQQQQRTALPYLVEIADCDDVEVYVETLRLMYCKDLRKKLMKEDVSKVLGILKVKSFSYCFVGFFFC